MQEKLTILISAEHKKFIKGHARRQNKSVSRFIDDLLSSIKREAKQANASDEWVDKTAGSYATGKKDILNELFKGIGK
ncbi:MAG: DUF6364 family protein [Ginsengibacter sp.]